ncbi:MAG: DUF1778 domain-containing protein [Solirubrobacterales bacterium]
MGSLKTNRIAARISPEDDLTIRQAAAQNSMSVSDYLVESAVIRAQTELADHLHVVLGADTWDAFTAALDEPPVVNEKLVRAIARAKSRAA